MMIKNNLQTFDNNLPKNLKNLILFVRQHLFWLAFLFFLFFANAFTFAQTTTTLVAASGDGGFETGTTFALNNWNVTTGTNTQSQWVCNTGASGFTGSRCAYISNTLAVAPPTYSYNTGTTRVSHLYRNFTIPTTASTATLSFSWKATGEACCDYLSVYFEPATNAAPVYGTLTALAGTAPTGIVNAASATSAPTTRTLYNSSIAGYTAFQTVNIAIPSVYFNNTAYRLVFVWRNDGSLGTQPPAAIDNIQIAYTEPPSCSGTPTAGTATISSTSGCAPMNINLSTTGTSVGPGITYQWQSASIAAGPYTNITGATNTSTTITGAVGTTYYQLVTRCANSGLSATTTPVSFTGVSCGSNNVPATGSATINCGTNTMLYDNGGSAGNYVANSNGYTVLDNSGSGVITLSGTYGGIETNWDYLRIYAGVGTGGTLLNTITLTAGGTLPTVTSAPGQPLTILFTSDGSGQYAGFAMQVIYTGTCAPGCSGIPASGGTASISATSGCANTNVTLSATGLTTGPGLTYQWQSASNASGPWTNIAGATAASTNIVGGSVGTTYYQIVTTCTISGLSANSSTVSFTGISCASNNVPATGNNLVNCGTNTMLYDNGGSAGNYVANSNGYTVLDNSGSGVITLSGTYGGIETNFDYLRIYAGVGTGGTLLNTITLTAGGTLPTVTSAPGQPLTILFTSDGSGQYAGFAMQAIYTGTCAPPSAPNCIAAPTSPTNGQTGLNPSSVTLSWPAASGATGYNVYFGTSSTPTLVSSNQAGTTYNAGTLSSSTPYYWQVVPTNSVGAASGCAIWTFTTGIPGCSSGTYFLSYTPTCSNGSQENYSTCTYAGEYNILTLTSGITYTFGTTTANDYITIRNGTTVLAAGIQPIVYTAPSSSNYTVQVNLNSACGTDAVCHTTWIQCPVPQSSWQSQFISMNTGSSTWCAGEVRTVTVTVKNIGTQTWTNSAPDINIGVKWNADPDYLVRTDANGLAPGATGVFTLSVTAPTISTTENLTFDIVNEGNFWFGNNNNGGGPGNSVYQSSAITIAPYATTSAGTNTSICVGNSAQLNGSASSTVNAVATLTTTYAGGNGCTNGNMFDIVSNTSPLTITGFSINPGVASQNISVYYKVGTYVGSETNSAAWTLVGTYAANGTINVPLRINIASFTIPASSTYGIYINGDIDYTNSTTSYSNADMTINVGAGLCGAFTSTNSGRAFNGAVIYTKPVQPTLTYSWSPSSSLSSASILNPVATPSASLNYSLSVTSASTCPASSSVSVTVNSPSISPTPASGDFIWCGGTSVGWSVPSNWYVYNGTNYSVASSVSTSTDNVIIPPNGTCVNQQPIVSIPGVAQNITINSGASLTLNTGSTVNSKNLTIASTGTLVMNATGSSTFNIAGNWLNNGIFNAGVGTVNFNGTTAQSINKNSGNELFANLIINKSSGGVTLNSPIEIATNVTFTSGILNSDATNLLIINDNATSLGASNISHVVGPVRKIGNDAFTFPLGKGGNYAPAGISAPSLTTDHFTAEYFNTDPNPSYDRTQKDNTLNNISACEYWMINRTNGSSSVSVNLSWNTPRSCGVNQPSDLRVARWDGTTWKDHGNGGTSGNATSGDVVTSAVVSNFSPFTLASSTGINPLPIELTNYELYCENKKVVISWSTASETNNDYYTIERSLDGVNFEPIAFLNGHGTSVYRSDYSFTDINPIDGLAYYQIKQTDFNGQSKSYALKSVECGNKNSDIFIYPNPNKGIFVVEGTGLGSELIVTDVVGKIIYRTKGSDQRTKIDLHDLSSGIYYLNIGNNEINARRKIVIN